MSRWRIAACLSCGVGLAACSSLRSGDALDAAGAGHGAQNGAPRAPSSGGPAGSRVADSPADARGLEAVTDGRGSGADPRDAAPERRDVPGPDAAPVGPGASGTLTGWPAVRRGMGDDLVDFPQYLAVRKSGTVPGNGEARARCEALLPGLVGLPFFGSDMTCVIARVDLNARIKDPRERRARLTQAFEEVRTMVGADRIGDRRLAVMVYVTPLSTNVDDTATYMRDLGIAARAARMPLLIGIDATNWWEAVPDLWNFFDPAAPGYDPANVANVEWTGATADTAPRHFWRNWGSQIRVNTPIPNLASRAFRARTKAVLGSILPGLRDFADNLPPDEAWLFGGVVLGMELSVGVNHYFYPGGNRFFGQPRTCDPGLLWVAGSGCPNDPAATCGRYNHNQCPPSFRTTPLNGGVVQVGYRAAMDMRLLEPGQPMTKAVLDAEVNDYVDFLRDVVRDEGLPLRKMYTHVGGTFDGVEGVHSTSIGLHDHVVMGWTAYWADARVAGRSAVGTFLGSSPTLASLPWSYPEWLPYSPAGKETAAQWHAAIEAPLSFRNSRMIAVANWEGIYGTKAAIEGLGLAMTRAAPGACVTTPRMLLGTAVVDGTTGLRFSRGQAGTTTTLNASTVPLVAEDGHTLRQPDVASVRLEPDDTTFFFPAGPSRRVHVQLVTEGCLRDGATQRTFSSVIALDAQRGGRTPTGPVLFSDQRGAQVILSFAVPAGSSKVRLQIARDASFKDLGSLAGAGLDRDVTAERVFVTNDLAAGAWFARLLVERAGAGAAAVSNVVSIAVPNAVQNVVPNAAPKAVQVAR